MNGCILSRDAGQALRIKMASIVTRGSSVSVTYYYYSKREKKRKKKWESGFTPEAAELLQKGNRISDRKRGVYSPGRNHSGGTGVGMAGNRCGTEKICS